MMADVELDRRFEAAKRFALAGGQKTLTYFRSQLEVERKEDDSPVTRADREAEQLIRERILAEFPSDGILGEEFGKTEGKSGFEWILDPIDGTKSFIHGVPLYGTMVGLLQGETPVAGVIEIPALDERIAGAVGLGAWYQRGEATWEPARVSATETLSEGLFLTSEVGGFEAVERAVTYQRLERRARLTRTWGDCFGYLMVVTGRAELMIDAELNIWDAAAVLPILEEAGGRFTDWQGQRSVSSGNAV
ncbi:MAG: histidinol-phosphatase, partial [Planctomycetota bacterium]